MKNFVRAGCLGVLLVTAVLVPTQAEAGWSAAKGKFLQAVGRDDDHEILSALTEVARFDNADVAKLLVRHGLPREDMIVHREVFNVLTRLKDEKARKVVIDAVTKSRSWEVRASAARVAASYAGAYAFAKLKEAAEDKKWQVRSSAIRAITHLRLTDAIPFLIGRLKEEKGRVRWDLKWGLEHLTGEIMEPEWPLWNAWWTTHSEGFKMPTLTEAEKKIAGAAGGEEKDVHTAVREGLYGPIYSERIAFLFDISGSMRVGRDDSESRIQIAKSELIKVLENQLSPTTYFNIVTFSAEVNQFTRTLQKAKEGNLRKALAYVQGLKAGGETNAWGALQAAFDDPDVDTIYLLSDGTPTVGDETIPELIHQKILQQNRDRRIVINCIGFFPGFAKNQDKKSARAFLRKLALDSEGIYKEIY